jgi:hypothetical protein
MKPTQYKMTMREFLEFQDGHFRSTQEVLERPDTWRSLTPESQRLVKRYAAALSGSSWQDAPEQP